MAPTSPPVPGHGVRLPWTAAPGWLRAEVAARLGARVVAVADQPGGFSPGPAARLLLADGSRAFVKAASDAYPATAGMHRREAKVLAGLPAAVPAPRLLDVVDREGWVALLVEDVEGRPPTLPWSDGDLAMIVAALDALAQVLTPPPGHLRLRAAATLHGPDFIGLRRLTVDPPADLDPWLRRHLPTLAGLEADWEAAAAGDTVVHYDVRADNLLLTDAGVVLVDWAWACVGAPWLDLAFLLPSVAMQGGPAPEQVVAASALLSAAEPAALTAVVAALTGYLEQRCRQPPPPGLPTLRAFQAAQAKAARAWLRQRTGLG